MSHIRQIKAPDLSPCLTIPTKISLLDLVGNLGTPSEKHYFQLCIVRELIFYPSPITYSGSFTASGVGILSVYGWSTNPLVEYYIMETDIGYQKVGTQHGTLTSDGGTYEIWEHQQVNQPSIQGTSTFNQYISIRGSPRTSGTITVANHFNAWKAAGLTLGSLNYQVLAVESWTGSGNGKLTVAKGTGSGTTTPPTTTSPSTPVSSSPSGGGGSVAHWGQW